MCYASYAISQNHIPIQQKEKTSSCEHISSPLLSINFNHEIRLHLHNPIFVNEKIWGLQITMHYHRSAVVQIVHSSSLKIQRNKLYQMGFPGQLQQSLYEYNVSVALKDNRILQYQGPSSNAFAHLIDCLVCEVIYTNFLCIRWSTSQYLKSQKGKTKTHTKD